MPSNPYAVIQAQYSSLPRVGKKIADYILQDPTYIPSISVQQMARELSIAESSIIRFCKNLGYSGFSELKLLLVKYAPKAVHTIFEDLSDDATVAFITKNVFARNIDTLERTLDMLDYDKIEQAADCLSRAQQIMILGVGASGTIADDFYIRLMRIGIRAAAFTDSHLMQIAVGQCDETVAVIGISHTGKTHEIVHALELAKSRGAVAISITGYLNTPVKQVSDICLELYSPEQLFVSPRVAQVSMLDSLYVSLAIRRKESVVENIKKMHEALEDFRVV